MPAFCVQYHPEASAGPHDSNYLFAQFRKMLPAGRYHAGITRVPQRTFRPLSPLAVVQTAATVTVWPTESRRPFQSR